VRRERGKIERERERVQESDLGAMAGVVDNHQHDSELDIPGTVTAP